MTNAKIIRQMLQSNHSAQLQTIKNNLKIVKIMIQILKMILTYLMPSVALMTLDLVQKGC